MNIKALEILSNHPLPKLAVDVHPYAAIPGAGQSGPSRGRLADPSGNFLPEAAVLTMPSEAEAIPRCKSLHRRISVVYY